MALRAAIGSPGPLAAEQLVASSFMWAEVRSALHGAKWRGEQLVDDADPQPGVSE